MQKYTFFCLSSSFLLLIYMEKFVYNFYHRHRRLFTINQYERCHEYDSTNRTNTKAAWKNERLLYVLSVYFVSRKRKRVMRQEFVVH